MNAQACNLATTNWIRISGGFIPPGSAWSPVFHCNSCQSWGATEVHIWQGGGGFVPAFNSACVPTQCKPLWSRLPVSSSRAPRVRPLGRVLSSFGLSSFLLYMYKCLPLHAVHLLASKDTITHCREDDYFYYRSFEKNQQRFVVGVKWGDVTVPMVFMKLKQKYIFLKYQIRKYKHKRSTLSMNLTRCSPVMQL